MKGLKQNLPKPPIRVFARNSWFKEPFSNSAVAPCRDYLKTSWILGGEISDMILYLMRRADGHNRVSRETTIDDTATPIDHRPRRFNAIPVAISRNMPCRLATRGWRKTEKSQESAKVPAVGHKCPNYLAAGIRSTAIIWTATPKSRWPSKFAGRTRERGERPRHPFSPPSLSEFAFRRTKLPPPPLPLWKPPSPFCHPMPGKPIPFTSVFPNGRRESR